MNPRCRCGKIAWASEQEALDTLVRLKIKASLRGKTKRKETRAYPCDVAPGWWHLTSLPEYSDPQTRVDIESVRLSSQREAVDELLELAEQQANEIERLKDILVSMDKKRTVIGKERDGAWAAACQLGRAIQRHMERTAQPTGPDQELWRSYTATAVPVPAGQRYVVTAVRKEREDVEGLADGRRKVAQYGIPRLTAAAISCFPLATVSRSVVRAMLPTDLLVERANKGKGNEASRRMGIALKEFEERGWIVRRDTWLDVIDPAAVLTFATQGCTQDPRQALDAERAIKLVTEQPSSDQRDGELAALHALQPVLSAATA